MKGLIIKPYWADLILSGAKSIELRGNNTKIRGTIGIIKSGSKMVYGTVDLINCISIKTKEDYLKYAERHKVSIDFKCIPYKNLHGWVLENPVMYKEPVAYDHKQGCVIWVNL